LAGRHAQRCENGASRLTFRARYQAIRKSLNRFFGRPENEVERLTDKLSIAINARDWDAARVCALTLGEIGEQRREKGLMKKAGRSLRRLGEGHRAWKLLSLSKTVEGRSEWTGEDLADKSLLVERREGDLAIFFQFASLLGIASASATRTIVAVEPRVAPLYGRSFPLIEVRIADEVSPPHPEGAVFASFETLAVNFWPDDKERRAPFTPLTPDSEVAGKLRSNYLRGQEGPLIGIAWGSSNKGKDLPELCDWEPLLKTLPGRFVSLQYGDVGPALAEFERMVPGRMLLDPSVDQLADIDRFAAQLATLDAIITISNTGAHLAGALAVPTIVMLGDRFHLTWPAFGNRIAQYPTARLVHKAGRNWSAVMDDAHAEVLSILSGVPR
jgi:hypothetical protein